jgi:hypothetical protein
MLVSLEKVPEEHEHGGAADPPLPARSDGARRRLAGGSVGLRMNLAWHCSNAGMLVFT